MTKLKHIFIAVLFSGMTFAVWGQGLDPQTLLKPATDSWPSYSGDYTGRRYSPLAQINASNVKNLTLAWIARVPTGPTSSLPGASPFAAVQNIPTTIGGEAKETVEVGGPFGNGAGRVVGTILQVNGVLYMSAPDNAWAVDALDGHVLWHYFWRTRGGTHIGNRGMAMYHDWLYFETPDDYLVSLDSKTGKERWHKEISDFNEQYFSTAAPLLVGDHLLVGTGDDLDAPGFLQSFDPETGDLQWKFYTVPMKPGDAGLNTWPSLDAATHGGAQTWGMGSYDPDTKLYIFGTGNPTPGYFRPEGDNLFTCSLVAVNVDNGKMAWYYQTSPHDTHDWDSTQVPVLVDGEFNGRPRKLVLQATRNGYFFVLDRITGEHLLTSQFGTSANWAKGLDKDGRPVRNPQKDSTIAGALVSTSNGGSTNWPPPAYSPDSGLFYVAERDTYSMYYQTVAKTNEAMGLGGKEEDQLASLGSSIEAIDYKTGKIRWKHIFPSSFTDNGNAITGLLTTAGKLLFGADGSGNFIAFDPSTGKPLWHTRLLDVAGAPETYLLDGKQYVIVSGGDMIYAFKLN